MPKPVNETLLSRGVHDVIVRENLEAALKSGKILRVKFGIDPTAPQLHLGHLVVLKKLKQFQDAGHKIILIIGDFTAMIGDPSGRSETRKSLSKEEVKNNLKKYKAEAGKILDLKKADVFYNSKWHGAKNSIGTIFRLASFTTVQQLLEEDMFKRRFYGEWLCPTCRKPNRLDPNISDLNQNQRCLNCGWDGSLLKNIPSLGDGAGKKPIYFHEFLYPLLQGYDSVMVKADVEIGGTDQTFNLLMGRRVQKEYGQPEQNILTTPLLSGTDGVRKMSKSYGNFIALSDSPKDMFGKLMSVPDALIEQYVELLTDIDLVQIRGEINAEPYKAKKEMAKAVVSLCWDKNRADIALKEFEHVYSNRNTPQNMPIVQVLPGQLSLLDLVIKAGIQSKSEARRLIEQGAIEIDGQKKMDPKEAIHPRKPMVLKVGKTKFYRIVAN